MLAQVVRGQVEVAEHVGETDDDVQLLLGCARKGLVLLSIIVREIWYLKETRFRQVRMYSLENG